MTTSVRLAPQIERSLVEYCNRKGVTKTEVMSNAIVDYISKDRDHVPEPGTDHRVAEVSPIYQAFVQNGLIAEVNVKAPMNGASASKIRLREVMKRRLNRKSDV